MRDKLIPMNKDRRDFLVKSGIGVGALVFAGPLLVGCVGSGRSVSVAPLSRAMRQATRTATVADVLANLDNFTAVTFGKSKPHGVAFLESKYAVNLQAGSYVAVEKDKGKIKVAVDAVKAADSKTALKVLRMRNDQGDFVEMGFAWGGVGQMSLNAETGALTVRNFDPATDSPGGGGGGGCFTGDTNVLMADGSTHEIGDIVAGDMVLGYDFEAGQPVPARVSRVYHGMRDHHYVMNGPQGLRVTGEHPFCTGQGEFTQVKELRERERVLGFLDGDSVELQGIGVESLERVPRETEIFNITVDDVATFCVISVGVSFLVHNKGGSGGAGGGFRG